MELGWEGPVIMKKVAQDAHRRYMLKAEPRAKDPESVALLALHVVEETTHRNWLNADGRGHRREVALGAGECSRYLTSMRPDHPPGHVVCRCGHVDPGRVHLTWECPFRTTQHLRDPVAGVERELLLPLVPRFPAAARRELGIDM